MNTRLTLNIDKTIVEQAKNYAKNSHVSLSKLIEDYLSSLATVDKSPKPKKTSALVESLTGLIPSDSVGNRQDDYRAYLAKKYL